jgi:hypothetical protein
MDDETKNGVFLLKPGGSAIIGAGFLFLLGLLFFYLTVCDFLQNGISWAQPILLIFGLYFFANVWRYFHYNKIRLSNDSLETYVQGFGRALFQFGADSPMLPTNPKELRRTLFPKYSYVSIDLSNIQHVLISRLKEFEKLSSQLNSNEVNEAIVYWHQILVGRFGAFPLWVAAQFSPEMFIKVKSGNPIFMSLKPYSKNGFKRFLAELQKRNISFTVEPSLHLL